MPRIPQPSAITPQQAVVIHDDLQDLKPLRENRVWLHYFVPELERMREEHRVGMNDHTISDSRRCEHITAWEDCMQLLELLDKTEKNLRAALKAHDDKAPFLSGKFNPT